MNRIRYCVFVFWIACVSVDANSCTAAKRTLRFQEGMNRYRGTQDVVIGSFEPDLSDNGPALRNDIADNEPEHFLEALIRFDNVIGKGPGRIPPGAKIVSATLRLTVYNGGSGIAVHRALEAWDERSSWRSLNRGLDRFVAVPDAKRGKANRRKNIKTGTIDLDVTPSLKAWVENRQRNFGWVIKSPNPGGTNSVGIRSSEFRQIEQRPMLIVTVHTPDQ